MEGRLLLCKGTILTTCNTVWRENEECKSIYSACAAACTYYSRQCNVVMEFFSSILGLTISDSLGINCNYTGNPPDYTIAYVQFVYFEWILMTVDCSNPTQFKEKADWRSAIMSECAPSYSIYIFCNISAHFRE